MGLCTIPAWTDIPDFGDVVGLRRLYKAALERIRQLDFREAHKRAWIAVLQA